MMWNFYVDRASFNALVFLDGFGIVSNGEVEIVFKKGDTFFLPAGIGNVKGFRVSVNSL